MKKEMLINVLQPEECRIAILEDGVLEELYVERTSQESYVGNIYKGRIVNIEPSIQAAFVDFGIGRNGFLHVSDVEPAYYRHLAERGERREDNGRPSGRDRGRSGDRGSDRDRGRGRRPERRREEPEDAPRLERERTENAEPQSPDISGEQAPPSEEPRGEGEQRRGRSRGRGRRRRGSGERGEPRPETSGEPTGQGEAPSAPGDTPEFRDPPPDERPHPMDSAEHRTEGEEPETRPQRPEIDDSDLFFPRDPAPSSPHAPQQRPIEEDRATEVDLFDDEEDFDQESFGQTEEELAFNQAEEELATPTSPLSDEEFDDVQSERMSDMEEAVDEPLAEFDENEEIPPPRGRGDRRGRDDRRGGPGGGPGNRPRGRRMFGRPGMGRPKPLIQDIFKRGQEVLVQVIKEGIGTKGPTLSTYISIAGRYLVLMPGLNRIGVSRKIDDEEQRRRLREILSELQPPKGLGFIIRTAGLDRTKKELQRDLAYLSRLWQVVVRRIRKTKSPCEIYQESDMITRTIRDTFTGEIDMIWVDEQAAFDHAQEFMQIVMPRYAPRIQHYNAAEPMFHKYGIEDEIAKIHQRHIPLPMGGSIVIDQTEALVAIDVNSGNFRADNNAEETAFQMNLLAAREIARQLRLRDLGGVIVNDFIDMREERHRREVERALRDAVRRDRARTKILRISQFGIIEMTRQRIRPSLKRSVFQDCPHCKGTGQVKTCESMSIDVMRMLQLAAHRAEIRHISVTVHDDVANYLHNKKRKEVVRLEEAGQVQVTISGKTNLAPETLVFLCYDSNNNEIRFHQVEETRPRRR